MDSIAAGRGSPGLRLRTEARVSEKERGSVGCEGYPSACISIGVLLLGQETWKNLKALGGRELPCTQTPNDQTKIRNLFKASHFIEIPVLL